MDRKHRIETESQLEKKIENWKKKLSCRMKGHLDYTDYTQPAASQVKNAPDEFDERLVMSSTVGY